MEPVKHALCIVVPVLDEALDLASRLTELQRFRKRGARVIVVDGGSSGNSLASPVLRPEHLHQAAQALIVGDDALFCRAEDGGHALVGLREPQPALFADMAWSTGTVMSDTRACAGAHGLRVGEIEPLWNVDLPEQLERLSGLPAKAVR